MNLNNKNRIDKLLEEEVVSNDADVSNSSSYAASSHARNLLFVLANGDEKFFNYSYLIAADYIKSEGCIRLEFTTHVVTLKGLQLESLFSALFEHRVRMIVCRDARYNVLEENEGFTVNGMDVVEK